MNELAESNKKAAQYAADIYALAVKTARVRSYQANIAEEITDADYVLEAFIAAMEDTLAWEASR